VSAWLVFAPSRADDDALVNSAWIAAQTVARARRPPAVIGGTGAVRAALEAHVQATPELSGLAFFGHGATDRLFDANCAPNDSDGPAAIDTDNVHPPAWIAGSMHLHALSGMTLAMRAVVLGAALYRRLPATTGCVAGPLRRRPSRSSWIWLPA